LRKKFCEFQPCASNANKIICWSEAHLTSQHFCDGGSQPFSSCELLGYSHGPMGGFHCVAMGKNKKVLENSPC